MESQNWFYLSYPGNYSCEPQSPFFAGRHRHLLFRASHQDLVFWLSQEGKRTGNFRTLQVHQKSSFPGKFCYRNRRSHRNMLLVDTRDFYRIFCPLLPTCYKKGKGKDERAFPARIWRIQEKSSPFFPIVETFSPPRKK